MKKKIALSLCLAIAPTLITLLSSLTPSAISSSLHPLIPSSLNAQIPADGLVAWYPFNGNANDESGNGNNGTVNGATLTTDRFGNANGAFNFSSSSNQFLNFHGVLGNFDADFSINVWFLTNGSPGYILSKRNDEICTNNWWVINPVGFEICQGIAGYNVLHHGVSFQSNTWHNYVISLSGNQLSLHVDGVLTNSINSNFNYTIQNSANLLAGIVNAPISGYVAKHNGRIDDIAIYNRALSSPEIQQLYQDQTGQVQQPLTCSITAPVTSLCAGSTTNLMINSSSNGIQYDSLLIGTVTNSITSQWNHTFNTTPGKQYKLVANALYTVGTYCPQLVNDPAFQLPGFYGDSNPVSRNLGGIQDGLYCTAFAPNDFIRPTPDVYNPNHVYSYLFTAVSNSFNVGFNDCCWGDNCGNAQFTLYEIIMPSILWSNGASTSSITVTPTTNTTYSCTVTQGSQTCTASVDISVNPNVTNAISASIIEGETYTLGAQTLTTAGTYTEVFASAAGCDSTVTLTLAVEPLLTCDITAPVTSICEGESVTLSVNTTGGAGASSQLPANLQQGLVAYYPFNGNANDESGNGNNGTVNGATLTNDRFGNSSSCYTFDGSSYINVANSVSLNNASVSVSGWFNSSEFATNDNEGCKALVGKWWQFPSTCNSNYNAHLCVLTKPGSFSTLGSATSFYEGNVFISNSPIDTSTWYFFTFTHDALTGGKIYINGALVSQNNITGSICNSTNPLRIGADTHLGGQLWRFFNGKIDDILIYNRALSPAEIQQLYTAQSLAWNTGATTSSITITPTNSTTYSCTVTQGNSTCIASIDITVNPSVTNAISATIIEGETYTLGAQSLTTAGTYTEVFTSASGCDSTVTLSLSVEPLLTCNITAPVTSICEGESVTLSMNTTGGSGASSQLPTNLQQGLVAYYPFNGNANDESGNGNNGTVNGATLTSDRFGNEGKAYGFDGQNFIRVPFNNSFNLGSNMTISIWYNLNADNSMLDSIFDNISMLSRHVSSSLESSFILYNEGLCWPTTYITNSNNQISYLADVNYCSTNEWNMLSLTVLNGEMRSYRNGVLIGVVGNVSMKNTTLDMLVGGAIASNNPQIFSGSWKGKLDELIIYNVALSPSEIQQLYTTQSFTWNTGATTSSIAINPTTDTTYSCTVTQGSQTCTASVDITVNPHLTNAISATIIEGETYTLGAQTLITAGTYTEVFASAAGCDSTVTLTLAVEPLLTCNITTPTTTLCGGESVVLMLETLMNGSNLSNSLESIEQITRPIDYGWTHSFNVIPGEEYVIRVSGTFAMGTVCPNHEMDAAYWLPQINGGTALNHGCNYAWYIQNYCGLRPDIDAYTTSHIYDYSIIASSSILTVGFYDCCYGDNCGNIGFELLRKIALLEYSWSNGATTSTTTVTPTANTTYSCNVTQGSQTCTDSITITVNPLLIWYADNDGDGFGDGGNAQDACDQPLGFVSNANDCNDAEALAFTGAVDLCDNGIDEDCSGTDSTCIVLGCTDITACNFNPTANADDLSCTYPSQTYLTCDGICINDSDVDGVCDEIELAGCTDNTAFNYNPQATNDDGSCEAVLTCDVTAPKTTLCVGESVDVFMTSVGGAVNSYISDYNTESDELIFDQFIPYTSSNNAQISYLEPGEYYIQVSGTWCGGPCWNGPREDAAYDFYNGNVVPINYAFTINEYCPQGINGCAHPRPVPDLYNSNHIYFYPYTSLGGPLTIYNVADECCWWDNQGGLNFKVYRRSNYSSINWSTGATTPSMTVSPTETTTYTATVTTATQTCSDSITITVNPLLDWYADADGDGFGDASNVVQDCNQPAGFVADNSDCNDEDAITYPGAEEICDNNRDDNCDGQVDENCAILGCTDPSACNYNEMANTDDNSCVLPQPEICDGFDNNCNNQIDEGLSPASINAVAATTALYPVCSGNSIKSANLYNGANSAVIDGSGNDLWYSFTAQFNTFRAGLSAASGDNDVRIYTMSTGGCLSLIETEHETTNGNQTLLTDQLTVGQTYYVAVHNISGPMNASAKICFNHLTASLCDHYYSNNTGIYTSVCNSFKAQYRANAVAYTFEILSATQNGVNQNITPWSYTTPSASTVVARLGTLLPANQGTSPIVYTMRVPVLYSLFDAAGNFENLYAQATATCTATLNAEPTIALRSSDRCPNNKSITSTIAPDRTVCGAVRYDWEFTEVLPISGTTQVVQGGAYASAFFLSNVPGVAPGKTYNVRVRPVHSSGVAGNWGSTQCLRIGNAGMILENHPVQTAQALVRTPLLSLRAGGEMNASYSIYPNPTASGSFVLQYNGSRRGELIFAQEPNTTESTSAQEPSTTESTSAQEPSTTESTSAQEPNTTESTFAQELVMMDITGKVVYQQQVVLNGNAVEVQFGHLASGVYLVMVGEERMRLIVE